MRRKTAIHKILRHKTVRHEIKDKRKILWKAFSHVLIPDTKNPDTNF